MNLFVFSSVNFTNIWAGIGAEMWAVAQGTESHMKALRTKAKSMTVGSAGVLYCTEAKSLTTPFLVYSAPDDARVVTDVWREAWVLPFRIHPLGTPNRLFYKDDAMAALDIMKNSGTNNISQALPIPAVTAFSSKAISTGDWAILLDRLAS